MKIAGFILALFAGAATTESRIVRDGPKSCNNVALTFDMCPVRSGTGIDSALIRDLEERRAPATFFVSGKWVEQHDADLRALIAVPFFEIGTHGETHASLPKLDAAAQRREIEGPVTRLASTYHVTATLFRPPYGDYNDETLRVAESDHLTFVMWSVVSGDPDPNLTADAIAKDVEWRMKPGSIVIFHANGRGWHTREVIDEMWPVLASRGLKPVTVTDLLHGCADAATVRR